MRHCSNCGEAGHYSSTCSRSKETLLTIKVPKIPTVVQDIKDWEYCGFTSCAGCGQDKPCYQPNDPIKPDRFFTRFPILCKECLVMEVWTTGSRTVRSESNIEMLTQPPQDC